jgi:hypothetical protein
LQSRKKYVADECYSKDDHSDEEATEEGLPGARIRLDEFKLLFGSPTLH